MRTRLDSLTGLRFFAALLVFGFHATAGLGSSSPVREFLNDAGSRGFVGVSFFYMLSGFVLTWSHREGDRLGAFYRRRFARIAPTYWACLAIGTLITLAITGRPGLIADTIPAWLGVQAWFPSEDIYFAGNTPAWSISVELLFYALFPALILLVARSWHARAFGVLAVAGVVALPLALHPSVANGENYWVVYIFPVARLGEFVVGILLARAMRAGWRSPVSLPVAVTLAVTAYIVATFLPYWMTVSMVTLVPFALVLAAAAAADVDGGPSPFRRPKLVLLGAWSFAFYLIHVQVLRVVEGVIHGVVTETIVTRLTVIVVSLVGSVIAAGILYTFLERPLEARLRGARPRVEDRVAQATTPRPQ